MFTPQGPIWPKAIYFQVLSDYVATKSRLWTNHSHFGSAKGNQRRYVGAGNSGMTNIADNDHAQFFEIAFKASNGKHVEHGLGWVSVLSIATVNNVDGAAYPKDPLQPSFRFRNKEA